MSINSRIKILRKQLKLSQDAFGEKIGVSRAVIRNIDNDLVEAKPLMIKHICEVYGVNHEWLEHGAGEMFDASSPSIIDQLAEKYQLSDTAKAVLEVYVDLTPQDKEVFDAFIEKVIEAKNKSPDKPSVDTAMKHYIYTAARSSSNDPPHYEAYTDEMLKRLEEAEEVPEDL